MNDQCNRCLSTLFRPVLAIDGRMGCAFCHNASVTRSNSASSSAQPGGQNTELHRVAVSHEATVAMELARAEKN